MRGVLAVILSVSALAGCARSRATEAPMTDRPLWAATIRSELHKPFDRGERESFKGVWVRHLSWKAPNYHPFRENWNDSWAAWRNVVRPH